MRDCPRAPCGGVAGMCHSFLPAFRSPPTRCGARLTQTHSRSVHSRPTTLTLRQLTHTHTSVRMRFHAHANSLIPGCFHTEIHSDSGSRISKPANTGLFILRRLALRLTHLQTHAWSNAYPFKRCCHVLQLAAMPPPRHLLPFAAPWDERQLEKNIP